MIIEVNTNYKGKLKNFPTEIVEKMIENQIRQGNPRDISVFEENKYADRKRGGFNWDKTIEEGDFWNDIITHEHFDIFYNKYPKKNKLYYYSMGNFTPLLAKGGVNLMDFCNHTNGIFYIPINGGIIMCQSMGWSSCDKVSNFVKENGIDLTPEKEILDKEEKEYLSAVIKPFNIRCIVKRDACFKDECFIEIWLKNGRKAELPNFKENTMYKGMKLNKAYTLEELGL